MPNVSEVLGGMLQRALDNPKTTVQSLLTCVMMLVPALLAGNVIHGKAATIAGTILAVSKVLVGMTQHDMGTVIPAGTTVEQTQTSTIITPKE